MDDVPYYFPKASNLLSQHYFFIFFKYFLKFTVYYICVYFIFFLFSEGILWRGISGTLVRGVNGKFYNWNILHPTVRIMSTTIKTERANKKREQITIVNFHFIRDHEVKFLKNGSSSKDKRGKERRKYVAFPPHHKKAYKTYKRANQFRIFFLGACDEN